MKILAHNPRQSRNKEHIAIQADNTWHARCSTFLQEGDTTTRGEWVVRDEQPDDAICWNCQASENRGNEKLEPRPPLPCTQPDKSVFILERTDSGALVHSGELQALCNMTIKPCHEWRVRDGVASEITCQRCLKSLGLHKGHTPYVRHGSNKMAWQNRDMIFELWHGFTGKRHPDDHDKEPQSDPKT